MKSKPITQDIINYIKTYTRYDREEGKLYWAVPRRGASVGKEISNINFGYNRIFINKKPYKVHRIIYMLENPDQDITNKDIDHIDGNRNNNKINNLRVLSRSENLKNRSRLNKNNKTGCIGVYECTNKTTYRYKAYITHNKKLISLGYYNDIDTAILVRLFAEKVYQYPKNDIKYLDEKTLELHQKTIEDPTLLLPLLTNKVKKALKLI